MSLPEVRVGDSHDDQFRVLVEGIVDYAILGLDAHGLVTTWNSGAERIKGYQATEIIGRHFSVFYPFADVAAGVPEAELSTATAKRSLETEGWRVRRDGSQFWASVVITALFDDDHRLRGFAKVTRDITERRDAERALRASEERAIEFEARLAAVVEFSHDAIWSFNLDGTVRTWNTGAEYLYGYSAAEMIGQTVLGVRDDVVAGGWIPVAVGDEMHDIVQRVERGERVGDFETRRICKDGTMVDVSLTVSPIRGSTGALTGLSVVARDITERKRLDQVLALERRRLRAAESIGHIGSWEIDAATRELGWSETVLGLYGVDAEDFDGYYSSMSAHVYLEDRADVAAAIATCLVGVRETLQVRYRVVRGSDGELRWFDAHGERIYEEGRFVRLAGSVVDVTEVVEAARVMEAARDLALEASRQKSAFLATMSHEIRTPMNAVIGMTGLLLETDLDAEQREFVEAVYSSGDALLGIINDILDFSKIEAGGLELDHQPFDLRACLDDALELVAVAADAKGLELVGDITSNCPQRVEGDGVRLRQVLVNLLGNAVKFTARGEVVLTVEVIDAVEHIQPADDAHNPGARRQVGPGGEVGLHFSVTDTGIGIPAERLANLFDSFTQVDASTTRLYGGTGLGLAISHRLVEAMGATLTVRSTLGTGSTFSFSIILGRDGLGADSPVTQPAPLLGGRFALVVDDNATNRRILRLQLEGWDMRVTEAACAEAAITILASGDHFDVALLDMKMPGTNGADLAALLRSSPSTRLLPLILLSSYMDRPSPQHRPLFSAILTKPIRATRLQMSLRHALATIEAPASSFHPEVTAIPDQQTLQVLLVEDNPINQVVARRMLEKLGHRVDMAGNGREAVEAVRLTPYDVLLMDVQMPEMDGLEATRLIRSGLAAGRQPRIVAMTASVLVEDRQACRQAGMEDYLPKPVRIDDLESAIRGTATTSVGASRRPSSGS